MVEDREKFEQIRQEFVGRRFRRMLDETLLQECFYCGTKENLTYHHLIPVANGGDNRISNIICVCSEHHKAMHDRTHTHTADDYKNGKKWGCPKTPPPENYEYFIRKYLRGDIGVKEFWGLLKLPESKRMKISEKWWFKEFLREHRIKDYRNNVEHIKSNSRRTSRTPIVSRVTFESGNSYTKYKDGRTEYITKYNQDDYKFLKYNEFTYRRSLDSNNNENNDETAKYLNKILSEE